MKTYHLTSYRLYRAGAPFRVLILSDIHFSRTLKSTKLRAVANFVRQRHPDYIFIPGDLIDANDTVDDPAEQTRLLNWLEHLGSIAPTFFTYGNHDLMRYASRAHRRQTHNRWTLGLNRDFFTKLAAVPNLHLLENTLWTDSRISVYGLALPPEYYRFTENGHRPTMLKPLPENRQVLLDALAKLQPSAQLPPDRLNFALVHAPAYLKDPEVLTYFQDYHFLISGHMHHGLVPPLVDELWSSDRGLISPTRQRLPHNSRYTLRVPEDKLIVSGAVTTFQQCSGPLQLANLLYPIHLTELNFSSAPELLDHPQITRRYRRKA